MKFVIFLLILLGMGSPAYAQECSLKKPQDLLDCVLLRHPDVQEADITLKRDQALRKIARQRANPEIESKMLTGDSPDGQLFNTETTLLHTLEVGGKRGARIKQAQAQMKLASVRLRQTQEEVALQTVLAAHRLRQIKTEKRLARENTETFDKIVSSYHSRSLLSPEQQVSLNIFETGQQEMALKSASMAQEESELTNYLVAATGASPQQIERLLPSPKKKWPSLPENVESTESSIESQAAGELELARGNSKIARSESWPDIRIGPTLETEKRSGDTSFLTGGSIQVPLPILSLNRGNRTYARLEEERAKLRYEAIQKKAALDRKGALVRYKSALKSLKIIPSTSQSHQIMDDLFDRGLVTTSLMIEAHRQNLEIAEMRHAQELEALESLWTLLILDGRLSEGTL